MIQKTFKPVFIIILLTLTTAMYSQSVNIDVATERNLMSKNLSKKLQADGSPYINEVYTTLKIQEYKDRIYLGRYNAYNDEMEIKFENGKVIALDNSSEYTIRFTLTNKTYKTFSYTTKKGMSKRGFLVVLDETEKYTLLKREYIKYYEAEKATSSYQKDKSAKFKRESDSYFFKINDKIIYIPQKKKSFLKAFPENSAKLKTFIKQHKIDLKKEDDLKKVLKYFSEL